VDRASAITRLPEPYAVAIHLHDVGRDDEIAGRLGIDAAGVPALLKLGEAKLARLLDADQALRRPTT
jgi:DNA-directed RNA polymerase specialized sigma24 family protein